MIAVQAARHVPIDVLGSRTFRRLAELNVKALWDQLAVYDADRRDVLLKAAIVLLIN